MLFRFHAFLSSLSRSVSVAFSSLQVATDKCIMLFLFLIVCGVIAIIIVKVFCITFAVNI